MLFKQEKKKRRWPRILVAVVMVAVVGGIGATAWPFLTYPTAEVRVSVDPPRPTENIDAPVAGMAEVDITPPVGIPKFGYSTWAKKADGFRTRLKARAFYLHAPGNTPMALVQLDLGAGSRLLHAKVAELIAAETDVPGHALSLLSTHTHSGPGQYLGSDFYNVFGSNRPGFDPELFEFLAQRIAQAVIEAHENRREARFATGQTQIRGLTRNRSVEAWARNEGIPGDEVTEAMRYQAINPDLTLLRIDQRTEDGDFRPAGALSFFSIHGTAIPAFTRPYHADVWAWLARDLEHHIRSEYDTPFEPVHGAAQATHGDNTPAWQPKERGDRAARRIGKGLGEAAVALFSRLDGRLSDELTTAVASRQTDLLDLPKEQRQGLCRRAIVGAAVVGGARGDEVFPISYLPWIEEGWPRRIFTGGCHGTKHWMLSKLQRLLPKQDLPHQAVFQVLRINDLVLAPVPWEVTFESGNRMRKRIRAQLPEDRDWLVEISSVANGYFGYATTEEEYSAQHYEGGHTLYGPRTTAFLTDFSARLTEDLFRTGEVDDLPDEIRTRLLRHDYWPDGGARVGERELIQPPRFHAATRDQQAYWSIRYQGVDPARLDLHRPLLRIERRTEDGWQTLSSQGRPVNDQGTKLQIRLLEEDGAGGVYEVRWYQPVYRAHGDRRFRIAPRGGMAGLTSPSF